MQFSSIITSLFAAAATVSAVATPQQQDTVGRRAVAEFESSAKSQLGEMKANGCDVFGKYNVSTQGLGPCHSTLNLSISRGER